MMIVVMITIALKRSYNKNIKGLTEASETKGAEEEEQQTWKEQVVKISLQWVVSELFSIWFLVWGKQGRGSKSIYGRWAGPYREKKLERFSGKETSRTKKCIFCYKCVSWFQSSLINVSQFLSPSSPIETGSTPSIAGRSLPPEAESPQDAGHDSPTAGCSPPRGDCSPPRLTFSPVRRNDSPSILGPWSSSSTPRKLGHQRALVQGNNENETELNRFAFFLSFLLFLQLLYRRQVAQLMVSSYDPVLGKTIWQCAQCHYSSKLRWQWWCWWWRA